MLNRKMNGASQEKNHSSNVDGKQKKLSYDNTKNIISSSDKPNSMKVICIDASEGNLIHPFGFNLIEGDAYTVTEIFIGELTKQKCYRIAEDTYGGGYLAKRFVPLSSIDETEMIREYNLTPEKLKAHSISWYTKRLSEETRIEARSFLRSQLYFLRKKVES